MHCKRFWNKESIKERSERSTCATASFFLSDLTNATGFPTLTIELKSFDFEKIRNGMGKRTNIA